MADKIDKSAEEINNYAARHPRRMYSGMFILGTALGASMVAAKKSRDKSPLQKFMDQLSR